MWLPIALIMELPCPLVMGGRTIIINDSRPTIIELLGENNSLLLICFNYNLDKNFNKIANAVIPPAAFK